MTLLRAAVAGIFAGARSVRQQNEVVFTVRGRISALVSRSGERLAVPHVAALLDDAHRSDVLVKIIVVILTVVQ